MFLQADRDRLETDADLTDIYTWDRGLPDIDVLFLEWRRPIADRNTTKCATPGHTCDLHRQQQLLEQYVHTLGVPTILWDKDRKLPSTDPLRHQNHVTACEAALYPTDGATSLSRMPAHHTFRISRRSATDPCGVTCPHRSRCLRNARLAD